MKLVQHLLASSVLKLTRAACVFALLGLGLMSYSILDPRAVPVITAMSLGHAFGISAFACYLFAVVIDARRSARSSPSAPNAPAPAHTDAESAPGAAESAIEAECDSASNRGT